MKSTPQEQIIDYIRKNRVSTTEVSDCMAKSGVLEGVLPLNPRHFRVGNVKWVYAYDKSNWTVHEQIETVEEGDIVFIDAINCGHRAVVGELVSKFLLLYRQAGAIISNAKFRDASALLRENYPIWCTGVTPIGCFNHKPQTPLCKEIEKERRESFGGAVAVCDDCGVVLVPKSFHTDEFIQKLAAIEEQEDTWFERLDRHKESTFEIVCLRKYEQTDHD